MKNLLIIMMMTLMLPINAQEKQNDATWNETIDFIKKYKEDFDYVKFEINYDGKFLYMKDNKSHRELCKLTDLMQVETRVDDAFVLYFIRESVKTTYSSGHFFFSDFCSIRINNKEMYPRIFKAFKHLEYLATKKREEKRKASGDKF